MHLRLEYAAICEQILHCSPYPSIVSVPAELIDEECFDAMGAPSIPMTFQCYVLVAPKYSTHRSFGTTSHPSLQTFHWDLLKI